MTVGSPTAHQTPDVPYRSRSTLTAGLKSQADLLSELNLLGRTADARPLLADRWIRGYVMSSTSPVVTSQSDQAM